MIEHFTDLDKIINKLKKLLNPNGVLYILTPGVLNFEKYGFLNLVNQFKRSLFLFYLQNAHIYYFSLNSLKNIFVKYSNDFSYIYGDEEIQIILIKKESQKIIPFQNDYQKIIKFYKKNYFRYNFLKYLRFPVKILYIFAKKIKDLLGLKRKIRK